MRLIKYIVAIGLFLLSWTSVSRAQDPEFFVCAGQEGIVYSVQGWENSTFAWTVEGGTITRDDGDSITVDWPLIPGEYEITVQETSEFGCVGEMQFATVIVVGPEIDLGDDDYICAGDVFEITAHGDFESYLWGDGSTGSAFSTDQEGWIRVEVTDEYGCALNDSMFLTVEDLPFVDLGIDTTVCDAEGLVLDAGPDGDFYTWSTGDNGQRLTVYPGEGPQVWVIVENAYGCIGGDTIQLGTCDLEYYFRDIPTAFTPNGDGSNDVWEVDKFRNFDRAVIEVFSQWGTLVWRSEPGYSDSWDGNNMNGKPVPVDSYHFVIKLNDHEDSQYVGIVTVIK